MLSPQVVPVANSNGGRVRHGADHGHGFLAPAILCQLSGLKVGCLLPLCAVVVIVVVVLAAVLVAADAVAVVVVVAVVVAVVVVVVSHDSCGDCSTDCQKI